MKLYAHIKTKGWDYGDCEFVEIGSDTDKEIEQLLGSYGNNVSDVSIVRLEEVRKFDLNSYREKLRSAKEEVERKRHEEHEIKQYRRLKEKFEPSEF